MADRIPDLARGRRAYSLLEALVALAVLAIALASIVTLLTQHVAVDRRVDAHLAAGRVLEAQHEAIRGRGGGLALTAGSQELVPVLAAGSAVDQLGLWAEVQPLSPPGLYAVTLTVRYSLGKQAFARRLETRLWRP